MTEEGLKKPARKSLLSLAAAVLLGLVASFLLQQFKPLGVNVEGNRVAEKLLVNPDLPGEGPKDATLTVVVFSDYQCPACRIAEPLLLAAAREDGRVRLRYRDWPIYGEMSEYAARVALAARWQGLYVPVHQALMREPRRLDRAVIRAAAEAAGVNWGRLTQDMERHQGEISRMLGEARLEALAFNLTGTPAYLVGKRLAIGGQTEAQFRRLFAAGR